MTPMRKIVNLSQLKEIAILWPGDVHMLAEFILRSYDARDREVNARSRGVIHKSRPTLHGLAGDFAMLTKVPESRVEREFQTRGLDLGVTVEFDPAPTEADST